MSLFSSAVSSVAGALGQTGQNAVNSWLGVSPTQTLRKDAMRRQKAYDQWKSKLDFDYAQKYAENVAKWNVKGLMDAGLNPILAAQNGSFGSSSLGSSSTARVDAGQASLGSSGNPVNQAIQSYSALQQARVSKEQADFVHAQTENVKKTGGLTGSYAAINTLLSETGLKDFLKSRFGSSAAKDFSSSKSEPDGSISPSVERDLERIVSPLSSGMELKDRRESVRRVLDHLKDETIDFMKRSTLSPREKERIRRLRNGQIEMMRRRFSD